MRLVTIGGGELRLCETFAIDRRIREISGAENPKALFIPTASGDSEAYCQHFRTIYGRKLGCSVRILRLCAALPGDAEIEDLILSSDLIYVGGGNTERMLSTWRSLGVPLHLRDAGERGSVLSGLSAGAMCWYEAGITDSDRFSNPSRWEFKTLEGLAWLPSTFCPHLDAERRHGTLMQCVLNERRTVIGCDNHAGLVWEGETAEVVTARVDAHVHVARPDVPHRMTIEQLSRGSRVTAQSLR